MKEAPRIFLYSHDTFGLGHLRRNCKIANALAGALPDARIVIATGSPKAGSFALDRRIHLLRLPGIFKVTDGSYRAGDPGRSSQTVLDERARILAHAATLLRPHIFIADKEPLGLLGELVEALRVLRAVGSYRVLGLRDVLDDPRFLRQEWRNKKITGQVADVYDAFWVYGPRGFCDPLVGLDLPPSVHERTRFLGYIDAPAGVAGPPAAASGERLLVTAGGGGDGCDLMMAVLAAYERERDAILPAVFLLGPFMERLQSRQIRRRASALPGATVIDFTTDLESLLASAAGVVAMCGYNTFCEIVAQDKPALFIPRERPRREQLIRAMQASRLGWCTMIRSREALERPDRVAALLRQLPEGPRPSRAEVGADMNGLRALCALVEQELRREEAVEPVLRA